MSTLSVVSGVLSGPPLTSLYSLGDSTPAKLVRRDVPRTPRIPRASFFSLRFLKVRRTWITSRTVNADLKRFQESHTPPDRPHLPHKFPVVVRILVDSLPFVKVKVLVQSYCGFLPFLRSSHKYIVLPVQYPTHLIIPCIPQSPSQFSFASPPCCKVNHSIVCTATSTHMLSTTPSCSLVVG